MMMMRGTDALAKDEGGRGEMAVQKKEAARRLSVSVRALDKRIVRGAIKASKFGGRVLVPVDEIKRYLEALPPRRPGPPEKPRR